MEGPIHTMTLDALAARVGSEIGVSAWRTIDQAAIDAFGKLTGDQHFIHVDPARAAKVLPSGGTIAHGFFTLSLLSNMAYQVCPTIEGVRFPLNYGFNRLRFVAPVPVGSRVRGALRAEVGRRDRCGAAPDRLRSQRRDRRCAQARAGRRVADPHRAVAHRVRAAQ